MPTEVIGHEGRDEIITVIVARLAAQGQGDSGVGAGALEQLRPGLLRGACEAAGIDLMLRMQPGYDHSYYFISTFMADHLRWHAERLRG